MRFNIHEYECLKWINMIQTLNPDSPSGRGGWLMSVVGNFLAFFGRVRQSIRGPVLG